jgi:hypothetical protein
MGIVEGKKSSGWVVGGRLLLPAKVLPCLRCTTVGVVAPNI